MRWDNLRDFRCPNCGLPLYREIRSGACRCGLCDFRAAEAHFQELIARGRVEVPDENARADALLEASRPSPDLNPLANF